MSGLAMWMSWCTRRMVTLSTSFHQLAVKAVWLALLRTVTIGTWELFFVESSRRARRTLRRICCDSDSVLRVEYSSIEKSSAVFGPALQALTGYKRRTRQRRELQRYK